MRAAGGAGLPRGWRMSPAMTRLAATPSKLRWRRRRSLPSEGWLGRLAEEAPAGPMEALLGAGPRPHLCARRERAGGGLRHRNRSRRTARRIGRDGRHGRAGARRNPLALAQARRAAGGDGRRRAGLARRTGPRADRRRAPFARLAGRSAGGMGGDARPARRSCRPGIRRLVCRRPQSMRANSMSASTAAGSIR